MNMFSISEEASLEIQRIFMVAKCIEPVAQLYETSDPHHLFDDLKSAFVNPREPSEKLTEMAKARFQEVESQLKFRLTVRARERGHFQPKDIYETGGIPFVMVPEAVVMLSRYCLIFEDDRFLLKGPDKTVHTLRSIAEQ